jgi:hypothetical protein
MTCETIYVALLGEGTDVWRPVCGERLTKDCYRLLGPVPPDETWEFPPGTVVLVQEKAFSDGNFLVAVSGA